MIPVFIALPDKDTIIKIYDISITWQIPLIILSTLIFRAEVLIKALTLYLILGLFFLPIFHHGGSLGYLLTPNFGYLLGLYPLIKIIDLYNKNKFKISVYRFIRYGILGISSMHLVGIAYITIQMIYYKQTNLLIYNISKYSFAKFGLHILMLLPITILLRNIQNKNYNK